VQDATEVMQGFHSEKGMEMMRRLPKSKTIPENAKEVSQVPLSLALSRSLSLLRCLSLHLHLSRDLACSRALSLSLAHTQKLLNQQPLYATTRNFRAWCALFLSLSHLCIRFRDSKIGSHLGDHSFDRMFGRDLRREAAKPPLPLALTCPLNQQEGCEAPPCP